jgi:tetratricopeptide (TPR) repeat protein
LETFKAANDQDGQRRALTVLGLLHLQQEEERECRLCFLRALRSSKKIGDKGVEARLRFGLAEVCETYGRLRTARKHAERALRFVRSKHLDDVLPPVLNALAMVEMAEKNYAEGEARLQEALDAIRAQGDSNVRGTLLLNKAICASGLAKHEEALACYREAARIFEACGDTEGRAKVYTNAGVCLARLDRLAEAEQELRKGLALGEHAVGKVSRGRAMVALGDVLMVGHRQAEARKYFEEAHLLFQAARDDVDAEKTAKRLAVLSRSPFLPTRPSPPPPAP